MAYRVPPWFRGHFLQMFFLCYDAYLCWLVLSECPLLEYWTCMQGPFMPYMRLFQSMETVNITFLYLLLRRAEYLGQGERFLWLICSRREHLPQDRSLFRLQLLQVRFWSWLPCSFYSTWKLRPYKVDVTLFQFVNRKIVCEFWNDSNIP